MGILHKNLDQIDATLRHRSVDPYLSKVEEYTKLPRKYLGLAVILMTIAGALIGMANQIIVTIGFIYPAYKSIKAIESKSTEDDRRWLVYWVVYSTLIIFEYFSDILLFWIPMYYMLKSALLIWCMHPSYNGSDFIYRNIIQPAFVKHEKNIDDMIENAQTKGSGTLNKLVGEVGEIGEEVLQSSQVKEKMALGLKKAADIALSNVDLIDLKNVEPNGDGQPGEGLGESDKKDD